MGLNGLAVVSGKVDDPSSGAQLTVNGQPLDVEAGGSFAGVVNVSGQSNLSLALQNPGSSDSSTVTVPLNSNLIGPGGLLSSEALTALEQAGVTLLKPLGGFGETPIEIGGGLANGDQLATMSVNGVDALSTLKPGGSFLVPIPGTTREISILMTDKQGVSLDTTYRTSRSVSASDDGATPGGLTGRHGNPGSSPPVAGVLQHSRFAPTVLAGPDGISTGAGPRNATRSRSRS